MAGVNHKKVRQLINQKVKTINDRQFFSSRAIAGHFADMAAVQVKRYGYNRKVKVKCVWEPKNQSLACTQGELIWINAGHSLVKLKKTRPERYEIVCGLFAHELGHLLYTDFLASQTHANYMMAGKWFPITPPLRNLDDKVNEAEIWDYCNSGSTQAETMVRLMHEIANVLEDGYIEGKMLLRFPGKLGACLDVARAVHYESQPTLTEMIEAEDEGQSHVWLTILQLILSYVKWGQLKYGQEPLSDERIQTVFSMLGELDTALTDPSSKERWNIANIIAVRCWKYIKDFLEHCEDLSQNATASGNPASAGDLLSQLVSALAGASQQGDGDTQPVDAGDAKSIPISAGHQRSQTANQAAASTPKAKEPEDENENGTGGAAGSDDESESESDSDPNVGAGDEPLDSGDDGQLGTPPSSEGGNGDSGSADANGDMSPGQRLSGPQEPFQEVSKKETGRLPYERTDSLYAPSGDGEIARDDEYAGIGYTNSASDVERLLESMAEASVFNDLETKRKSELNDLAKSISYGSVHDGINVKVHRMTTVDDDLAEQYQSVSGDLIKISKKLQRSVQQKLKDKRQGGKMTNLLVGRRLDPHSLPRNDAHAFYKNILPNEAPELALGLLLDESGSMSSRDRATYARATAIILYDFCRALRIPAMIYGHTTSGGKGVDLYSYAEFDEIDRNDCYRLMDISSRGANRDGAALRYVADQLSKRPEEGKILILVSDGQPSDTGYYGTAAEDDLRGIKQEYQRKGVLFVAAAIGDDKANIERIYGDAFLDITDLNKLPAMLTDVIKQHLRV